MYCAALSNIGADRFKKIAKKICVGWAESNSGDAIYEYSPSCTRSPRFFSATDIAATAAAAAAAAVDRFSRHAIAEEPAPVTDVYRSSLPA